MVSVQHELREIIDLVVQEEEVPVYGIHGEFPINRNEFEVLGVERVLLPLTASNIQSIQELIESTSCPRSFDCVNICCEEKFNCWTVPSHSIFSPRTLGYLSKALLDLAKTTLKKIKIDSKSLYVDNTVQDVMLLKEGSCLLRNEKYDGMFGAILMEFPIKGNLPPNVTLQKGERMESFQQMELLQSDEERVTDCRQYFYFSDCECRIENCSKQPKLFLLCPLFDRALQVNQSFHDLTSVKSIGTALQAISRLRNVVQAWTDLIHSKSVTSSSSSNSSNSSMNDTIPAYFICPLKHYYANDMPFVELIREDWRLMALLKSIPALQVLWTTMTYRCIGISHLIEENEVRADSCEVEHGQEIKEIITEQFHCQQAVDAVGRIFYLNEMKFKLPDQLIGLTKKEFIAHFPLQKESIVKNPQHKEIGVIDNSYQHSVLILTLHERQWQLVIDGNYQVGLQMANVLVKRWRASQDDVNAVQPVAERTSLPQLPTSILETENYAKYQSLVEMLRYLMNFPGYQEQDFELLLQCCVTLGEETVLLELFQRNIKSISSEYAVEKLLTLLQTTSCRSKALQDYIVTTLIGNLKSNIGNFHHFLKFLSRLLTLRGETDSKYDVILQEVVKTLVMQSIYAPSSYETLQSVSVPCVLQYLLFIFQFAIAFHRSPNMLYVARSQEYIVYACNYVKIHSTLTAYLVSFLLNKEPQSLYTLSQRTQFTQTIFLQLVHHYIHTIFHLTEKIRPLPSTASAAAPTTTTNTTAVFPPKVQYSWSYPDAYIPEHDVVTNFLRSNEPEGIISGFHSIKSARTFIHAYFSHDSKFHNPCATTYQATAVITGRGRSTAVKITKQRRRILTDPSTQLVAYLLQLLLLLLRGGK